LQIGLVIEACKRALLADLRSLKTSVKQVQRNLKQVKSVRKLKAHKYGRIKIFKKH